MSGSAENRTFDEPGGKTGDEPVLSWMTARRMLPLVRLIIRDILEYRERLSRLGPERSRLGRRRHGLSWPERARRYRLEEEIQRLEQALHGAVGELDALGVALIRADSGQVGFPTLVNDRRAFFSWRPSEENLQYWHFAGEGARRPIPAAWVRADMGELSRSR